jgi:ubiquinone/menaquinone biosynthesis C-methylase UbiE
LDAGCGTGRDAVALSQVHNVTGVDLVKQKEHTGFIFEKADFCTYEKHNFDMVYSRFTYHTIDDKQQDVFLDSITKPGIYLCMEFRSDKGQDTLLHFGKTHFRNFINLDKFKQKVQEKFDIMHISEDTGFAPFGDEDPICIRAILRKQ